jgi:heat shock protein HtpX
LLVAPVCGAPALVLMVVLLAVGLPIVVAIVVPVLLAVALGAWLLSTSEAAVIGGLAMRPATEADQPRLFNMVDGLCDSHGFRRPTLLVIDDDARNALVYGRGPERATLAVTRGWLASLSRMGLEGLLARELARCNDPGLATATTAASVARVLPGGLRTRVVRGVMGEHRVVLDDLDAVRFTRYPPGLAAALATQLDGTAIVAAAPRAGHHLWVTSPGPGSSILGDTPPVDLRIDALREL